MKIRLAITNSTNNREIYVLDRHNSSQIRKILQKSLFFFYLISLSTYLSLPVCLSLFLSPFSIFQSSSLSVSLSPSLSQFRVHSPSLIHVCLSLSLLSRCQPLFSSFIIIIFLLPFPLRKKYLLPSCVSRIFLFLSISPFRFNKKAYVHFFFFFHFCFESQRERLNRFRSLSMSKFNNLSDLFLLGLHNAFAFFFSPNLFLCIF